MKFREWLKEKKESILKNDIIIDDFNQINKSNFKPNKNKETKIDFPHKDGIGYIKGYMEITNDGLVIKKGSLLVLPYNIKNNEIEDETINNTREAIVRGLYI